APFAPDVRDALLRALLGAASLYVMFPLQDVFGWDVRINTPATVTEANWTWRVPVFVDRWRESPEWTAHAKLLAAWSAAAGRRL
ncbi:MAG TPA: 4-alpha-glucanotransferase, partial [Vicinamibacterales bacterium]|nr:4-alpha-glucanotransferase [Vicinamibacterales bacterium]